MKTLSTLIFAAMIGFAFLGCNNTPEKARPKSKEEKIQAALAKLSDEDRKLAEAQKNCAVETDKRLGSMGTPVKITIDGQAVFLCCDHCDKEANRDKAVTLKKAQDLKYANTR